MSFKYIANGRFFLVFATKIFKRSHCVDISVSTSSAILLGTSVVITTSSVGFTFVQFSDPGDVSQSMVSSDDTWTSVTWSTIVLSSPSTTGLGSVASDSIIVGLGASVTGSSSSDGCFGVVVVVVE